MTGSSFKKRHCKVIAIILLDIIIIAGLIIYFGFVRPHSGQLPHIQINGLWMEKPENIQDFKLINTKGESFDKDSFKGHWSLLFFGFTNCPMICPTTMDALSKMIKILQKDLPKNQLPQIVFISVDPDRDTAKRINDYLKAFNPSFIGVRTDISKTIAFEKQFHIAAQKIQIDDNGENHYTINHSTEIILLNPNAQIQAYFSYPHEPNKMASDYKLILQTLKG